MADLNAFSDGAQAARGGATSTPLWRSACPLFGSSDGRSRCPRRGTASARGAELTSDFAYDRSTHPKKRTEVLSRVLTLPPPLFKRLGVFFSLWQWLSALPPSTFSHFFEKGLTRTGMRGTISHTYAVRCLLPTVDVDCPSWVLPLAPRR